MTGMHGEHALVETAAALILSVGGALLVGLAWQQRRSGTWPAPPAGRPERRPSMPLLVAVLSGAAAAIHLAAAADHVEALGDVGLGFYWAALFQAGFAVAWLAAGPSRRLMALGVIGNGAIVAAWLASRTVGLPFLAGPEPIGLADAICAVLEVTVIGALVMARPSRWNRHALRRVPSIGVSGVVAIAGVAVLATVIAIVDVGQGHADGVHAAAAHLPSP